MARMVSTVGFLLTCFFLAACWSEPQIVQGGDVTMRIAIYPSGANETYLFEIREDGAMSCQVGTRRNDDIASKNLFTSIANQEEAQLSNEEVERITALADELRADDSLPDKELYLDSWSVVLSYCGEVYEADYWQNPSSAFRELVDEVIELSAFPVDLHGWA